MWNFVKTVQATHLPTCHQRQAELVPKMKLIIGELHGPFQTLITNNHTNTSFCVFEKMNQPPTKQQTYNIKMTKLDISRKGLVIFSINMGSCISFTHCIMVNAWEIESKFDTK